ncbi:hypothetical protein [Leptospira sp. 'Mane']|uniref:hypothetical protein n=1 Tax=Leptospira sp. 'Mane' TaxID=3387407 RepID=UPI00398B41E4
MKQHLLFILIFISLFLSIQCKKLYEVYENNVSGIELTDELIAKYVKAVKGLHKLGPDIPKQLAEKGESNATGLELFHQIESVIKDAGFKDYAEFVKVNAKVAWAWNVSQGELGIQKFQNMKDDGLRQIEDTLVDPSVPEEVKAELRKTKQRIIEDWSHNKKYADISMSIVRPLTNHHDLEIIKRNQKEIMEAYTGIPQNQLKEIDPTLFITE